MSSTRKETSERCPHCNARLETVDVKVEGATQTALSYQCPKCDYFSFDPASSRKVIEELQQQPLRIRQKIIKLSEGRLGIYLNKHIVDSLDLKSGADVSISVPDKKHIVLQL